MAYKKLVGTFKDGGGKVWKVFHASRHDFPKVFSFEGEPTHGMTFYKKQEIWIDTSQSDDDIFETTMHECGHVANKDLGLDDVIEESFVERFCIHVADYLNQLKA